jgi:hypothetical protein
MPGDSIRFHSLSSSLLFSRRFDPYTRSCTILASLFAIGFVLIVIVVLSLIPIYISQKSSKTTNTIQTTSRKFSFLYDFI